MPMAGVVRIAAFEPLLAELSQFQVPLPRLAELINTWHVAYREVVEIDPVVTFRESLGDVTAENIVEKIRVGTSALADRKEATEPMRVLDMHLAEQARKVVKDNSDAIVKRLRPQFRKAINDIAEAAKVLPAFVDAEGALAFGPDAPAAWQRLAEARATADAISALRQTLTDYDALPGPFYAVHVADGAQLDEAALIWSMGRPPELRGGVWRTFLEAGITPVLNTTSEAVAVINNRQPANDRQEVPA